MSRFLLTFVCFLFFGAAAFGQATLRVGDPIDLKIGGVPAEEQQQVNNIYTVDANGAVNLPYINKVRAEGLTPAQLASSIEATYRSEQNLHKSDDHYRHAATIPFCKCWWRGPFSDARRLH